jgi:hypothetical protein
MQGDWKLYYNNEEGWINYSEQNIQIEFLKIRHRLRVNDVFTLVLLLLLWLLIFTRLKRFLLT